MAIFSCNFYSPVLETNTSINVILPTPTQEDYKTGKADYFKAGAKFQTVFLLHGKYGDYTDWQRYSAIERYADERKVAFVTASVHNSMYLNQYIGPKYFTFISEEVPRYARRLFPIASKRENCFTAGLSMGGYGAFKVALENPGCFAACVSLSGAVNILGRGLVMNGKPNIISPGMFPPDTDPTQTDANLFHLIQRHLDQKTELPQMFLACGTSDFIYPSNVEAWEKLNEMGVDFHCEAHPGIHDWQFWDKYIQTALDWLPLKHEMVFE